MPEDKKVKTAIIKNVLIPCIDETLGYAYAPPELKGDIVCL